MPASSWTLWNRLFMIGRPCKEAGSSTTSIEAAQCASIRYTARLAEAGVEPSVGSVGDSYDALAETINGLYTAEVTHRCGPWRSCEAVEFATLELARGVGAALALPYADTDMMQLHLDEISSNVAKGAHAVVLLDRAGWHITSKLDMPENITPIFLPSRAPELNPVENVWQYLRQNWISNTVFENYDAIVDAACDAWRKLTAQPETITSIGMRDWAHVGQSL